METEQVELTPFKKDGDNKETLDRFYEGEETKDSSSSNQFEEQENNEKEGEENTCPFFTANGKLYTCSLIQKLVPDLKQVDDGLAITQKFRQIAEQHLDTITKYQEVLQKGNLLVNSIERLNTIFEQKKELFPESKAIFENEQEILDDIKRFNEAYADFKDTAKAIAESKDSEEYNLYIRYKNCVLLYDKCRRLFLKYLPFITSIVSIVVTSALFMIFRK